MREIPFAARSSMLVFDLKLVLLLVIFVYAFFRFTWSLRQYTFGALLVAAAPDREHFTEAAQRDAFASRAGRVMGLAAETFNDGLRGYYLSFAAAAWFFSPWALIGATLGVVLRPVPARVPLRRAGRAERGLKTQPSGVKSPSGLRQPCKTFRSRTRGLSG